MKKLLLIMVFAGIGKAHAMDQVQVVGPVKISTQSAVSITPSTSLATGWQAATLSAVVLPTSSAKSVCLKVLVAGSQKVYFGPSGVTATTGQELSPGDSWCGSLDNVNRVYIISTVTGSTVAYSALP